jgi:hypothetical protein
VRANHSKILFSKTYHNKFQYKEVNTMIDQVGQQETFAVAGKRMVVGGETLLVRFTFSYDDVLYIKVDILNQSDSLRGKGLLCETRGDDEDKKYRIISQSHPELRDKNLYICGNDKESDTVDCVYFYKTPEARNLALDNFCSMIEAINRPQKEVSKTETTVDNETGYTIVSVTGRYLSVQFMYKPGDDVLHTKILKQDESLRKKGNILNDDRYSIKSMNLPNISDNGRTLYIRGDRRDNDGKEVVTSFDDFSRLKESVEHFSQLIEKINNVDSGVIIV